MATLRFVGRGHPNVRATHGKTLELSPAADITERASCVIAVDARPDPAVALAGPVRITIIAGDERFTLTARANPSWDPANPAVIRRSPVRRPGTFATHADAASSDLPRGLVAALQDPGTVVEAVVESVPSTGSTAVLFAADPTRAHDLRLAAELEAADVVVAEDAGARHLVTARGDPLGVGRVLYVATVALPGVDADLTHRDIETVGLSPALAAAAATPGGGPIVLAAAGADVSDLLRRTPSTHRLALAVDYAKLPALLELAGRVRGEVAVTLAQPLAPPVRTIAELPTRETVQVCFATSDAHVALDPDVRAAIEGLLADGVSTKSAAAALATLTGWPRRRAYDAVLSLGATPSGR